MTRARVSDAAYGVGNGSGNGNSRGGGEENETCSGIKVRVDGKTVVGSWQMVGGKLTRMESRLENGNTVILQHV